jgi:hypothetical protein
MRMPVRSLEHMRHIFASQGKSLLKRFLAVDPTLNNRKDPDARARV